MAKTKAVRKENQVKEVKVEMANGKKSRNRFNAQDFGYCRRCGTKAMLNLVGECEGCWKAKKKAKRQAKAQAKREAKVLRTVREWLDAYVKADPQAGQETVAELVRRLWL